VVLASHSADCVVDDSGRVSYAFQLDRNGMEANGHAATYCSRASTRQSRSSRSVKQCCQSSSSRSSPPATRSLRCYASRVAMSSSRLRASSCMRRAPEMRTVC
jgi:hypothetical protein